MQSEFFWIAVAVVTALASARITRLFVWDSFPPSAWLRMKWDDRTDGTSWNTLLHCGYCFGMYAAGFVVLTGWLSNWHTAWWVFHGWLAASYVAAIVMAYDGDDD